MLHIILHISHIISFLNLYETKNQEPCPPNATAIFSSSEWFCRIADLCRSSLLAVASMWTLKDNLTGSKKIAIACRMSHKCEHTLGVKVGSKAQISVFTDISLTVLISLPKCLSYVWYLCCYCFTATKYIKFWYKTVYMETNISKSDFSLEPPNS